MQNVRKIVCMGIVLALMMPAVLFFVFMGFPAGLILYWTLFNVLSVLQTEFLHGKPKADTAPA